MSDKESGNLDAEEMFKQVEDAMSGMPDIVGHLKNIMEEVPMHIEEIQDAPDKATKRADALSKTSGLDVALESLAPSPEGNLELLVGKPNWAICADIRLGQVLRLALEAAFDLDKAVQTWRNLGDTDRREVVQDIVQDALGFEVDPEILGQAMGQVQKGRGLAVVKSLQVVDCRIPGVPEDVVQVLRLAPETSIPLVMHENGVGFDFAPVLAIRDHWGGAKIPTFVPTGEEIVVPMERFGRGQAFSARFTLSSQDYPLVVDLKFEPLK